MSYSEMVSQYHEATKSPSQAIWSIQSLKTSIDCWGPIGTPNLNWVEWYIMWSFIEKYWMVYEFSSVNETHIWSVIASEMSKSKMWKTSTSFGWVIRTKTDWLVQTNPPAPDNFSRSSAKSGAEISYIVYLQHIQAKE